MNFNPHLPYGRWRRLPLLHRLGARNFNPHLPYGRWLARASDSIFRQVFQSTPSLRKVTCRYCCLRIICFISIHTFLTEGDCLWSLRFPLIVLFQSTPSLRKVTLTPLALRCFPPISIHTFLTEGDAALHLHVMPDFQISIHTFLTEGD